MLKKHIENHFCKHKLLILKGYLTGYLEKYSDIIINPISLNNFTKNPITHEPYVYIKNVYVILSKDNLKKNGTGSKNPYYYVQIVYNKDDDNLLELGLGILTDNEFKFNMTETSSTIGHLTYNSKKDTFHVNRFSLPPSIIFIDQGEFNIISTKQFKHETNINV